MGRAEVGTPKYLANKMKAKGLQKLRWYCQMCSKQCRDENGFKCHTMSESHQRQLLLFADNSGKYIYSFSKQFSDGYLEVLRRRFGTKRVAANKVYQEYISDKNHLHMNATRWLTLTDYVKWLGRTGQCIADETEKGWFVTYIDRSPEAMEAQDRIARKEKMDKDDQERMMDFIGKQIERAKKTENNKPETDNKSEVKKFTREKDEPLKLNIKLPKLPIIESDMEKTHATKRHFSEAIEKRNIKRSKGNLGKSGRSTTLDDIIKMEEKSKEKQNRTDYWLKEGIIVKFKERSLGDQFYKQKAVIQEVIDKYRAKIKFLENDHKVKADQEHLETVIPAIGKPVIVVNGAYRNSIAIMKNINEDDFCVTIEISKGPLKGRILKNVSYEDVSKMHLE